MTVQAQKLERIRKRIASVWQREQRAREHEATLLAAALAVLRYALMLHHEYVRDDVHIRAESLSYLMIFSILPLIAGAFFFLTVFTQLSIVQEAISQGVASFLENIPNEHREFVLTYVLQFKDSYLASIEGKSGSVGIFALAVLVWIGLRVFSNVDLTINHIWSSEKDRPFLEQVRNFLVVSIVAPTVIIAGLSVPLILNRIPITHFFFVKFPVLATTIKILVPGLLLLGTFTSIYRYIPMRVVPIRAAISGALFATLSLQLTNALMQVYFKVGTNTAYGKAAAIPLIGFWIYIVWTLVILGAELSYLMVEGSQLVSFDPYEPNFRDGEAVLLALGNLQDSFDRGSNPIPREELVRTMGLSPTRSESVMRRASELGWIVETAGSGSYVLARSMNHLPIRDLLKQFFEVSLPVEVSPGHPELPGWHQARSKWLQGFGETNVSTWIEKARAPRLPTANPTQS